MATSDKRKLELEVGVDDKASKPLKQIGDAADKAEGDFGDLNKGLNKLDDQIATTTKQIAELRREVARSGDLDLIKDITKQEQRLKAFSKQRKSLLGDALTPDAAEITDIGIGIGARIGPFIVQSLGRAVASAGPGVAIGAPIAAGVVAYLGSAAAGALLGGAAVGAVAGGVALASRDSRVKTSAKALGMEISDQLGEASQVFVPATLGAIRIIRRDFQSMDGDLKAIFGRSAGYVQPLTRGVTGLVREALPGLRKGIESALPIVKAIERGLPRLGRTIGDLFGSLADDADEAAMAIDYLFKGIEIGVKSITGTLQVLTQAFGWIDKVTAYIGGNHERLAGYVNAQAQAEDGAEGFTAALQRLGQADPGTETLWQRQVLLNKSMADGIKQAGGLAEAFELLNGGALSAREAERNYQESIDAVTASIKENGKTLDVNTEKGRANQASLDALAVSGQTRAQTVYEQTLATKGQVAAEAAAAKAYQQGRDQLIKNAQQFGLNKTQARALADQIMAIPKDWSTLVKVNTGPGKAAIEEFKRRYAELRNKKLTVSAHVRWTSSGLKVPGGTILEFAAGGRVDGPGPKGRDSIPAMLAPGEHVVTSREVDAAGGHRAVEQWRKSLMSGMRPGAAGGAAPRSGGGAASAVTIRIDSGGSRFDDLLVEILRRSIGNRGGNVQFVLGTS